MRDVERAIRELGEAIEQGDRIMATSAEALVPAAGRLPVDIQLMYAHALYLAAIAGAAEVLLRLVVEPEDVEPPDEPPADVELEVDPMSREEGEAPDDSA